MTSKQAQRIAVDVAAQAAASPGVDAALHDAARLAQQGRADEAIALLRLQRRERPDHWPLAWALAGLLEFTGATDQAIDVIAEIATRVPEVAEAWHRLAGLLNRSGQPERAADAARRAVALCPDWPQAHNRLGCVLEPQDADGALAAFGCALALAPDWNVPLGNQARLLRELGRTGDAEALLREGTRRCPENPETWTALAEALLQQEKYDEGWRLYEWRFGQGGRTPAFPGTRAPIWNGGPLHGQVVMIWLEQGLGDQLQFCRYLPCIRALGGRVWLQTPRVLQSLLRSLGSVERFIDEGEIPEGFDVQIPLLSLPGVLHPLVPEIPSPTSYLSDHGDVAPEVGELLSAAGSALRIGLAYGSRPDHPSAKLRDCPLSALSRLAAVPGVCCFSLQFGSGAQEEIERQNWPLIDLGPHLADFAHTAAIVRKLDLVVTVDTAMAHLCGAIGHPVWTLLSSPCDWRWQLDRKDTPWYPSMRLYRQARRGDWSIPIERIACDLADLVERRRLETSS